MGLPDLAYIISEQLTSSSVYPFSGHLLVEGVLVLVLVYLLSRQSFWPEKQPLTDQEITQLCEEWEPEPLLSVEREEPAREPVLQSAATPRSVVDGRTVINMAAGNFLGLVGDSRVKQTCESTIEKYGVGACGPRGFYGTIDVHLDLEKKIAQFMGTPDSILYSYGLATASSTIPAFCKQGDLIVADEGVHWSIQNGIHLSRSKVRYFKHNNIASLRAVLEAVRLEDQRARKTLNRRFIVVEALYQNTGELVPLDDIIRLKEEYKYRVIVDESNSLGVLGASGRGISEHFSIPVEKLDIIIAAMGNALASVGGFCTGSLKVVDHQRLGGAGYCFSASLPPYVASASMAAIDILEHNPGLLSALHSNIAALRAGLKFIPGLVLRSHPLSPVLHLRLRKPSSSFAQDSAVLQRIADQLLEKENVLVAVARRTTLDDCKLPASLKLNVSAGHSAADMAAVVEAFRRVCSGSPSLLDEF